MANSAQDVVVDLSTRRSALNLGFVQTFLGGMEAAMGVGLGKTNTTQSGVGVMRDGLGDILSAMEAGQMDQASVNDQGSRVATLAVRLYREGDWKVVWERIKDVAYRIWILFIRPRIQQWSRFQREERASRE